MTTMQTRRQAPGPTKPADRLLEAICLDLQLREDQHEDATNRYNRAANHLHAGESSIKYMDPDIFPQGSMRLGTTNKPWKGVEYDLDLVCLCQVDPRVTSSVAVYSGIRNRLLESDDYKTRIEYLNRCIRLTYANHFHLDIIPACPDPVTGLLLVPDRESWQAAVAPFKTWKLTDPKGFCDWFESKGVVLEPVHLGEGRLEIRADIEPVPEQKASHEKTPLCRITQLYKRGRDTEFGCEKGMPSSILLTTLAGMYYGGQRSISAGLRAVLDGTQRRIAAAGPQRMKVPNPTIPSEDLAAPMTYAMYIRFVDFVTKMIAGLDALGNVKTGLPGYRTALSERFGEGPVDSAIKNLSQRTVEQPRGNGTLRVGSTGVLVAGAAAAVSAAPVAANTFFGD